MVEDNDIHIGEAYAPTRATSVESEIGTAQLQFKGTAKEARLLEYSTPYQTYHRTL